ILMAQRADLEARGATYVWSDGVTDLLVVGGRIAGVRCASGRELVGDAVILAVGHSARPIYELLQRRGVALEAKAFAVGARGARRQRRAARLSRPLRRRAARRRRAATRDRAARL